MVKLNHLRGRGVVQPIPFIIMLKVMLVSCTQQPADSDGVEQAHEEHSESSTESIAPTSKVENVWVKSDRAEGAEIILKSNFRDSVVVGVNETTDGPRFLSASFGATSHFEFFDKLGNRIDGGGFEGRPARPLYRDIDGGSVERRYDASMFLAGAIESAHSICFNFEIATEATHSKAKRHRICLRRK